MIKVGFDVKGRFSLFATKLFLFSFSSQILLESIWNQKLYVDEHSLYICKPLSMKREKVSNILPGKVAVILFDGISSGSGTMLLCLQLFRVSEQLNIE